MASDLEPGQSITVGTGTRGEGGPPEIPLMEQRTRLILRQGDTIYHGVISGRPKEETQEKLGRMVMGLETPAKSGLLIYYLERFLLEEAE